MPELPSRQRQIVQAHAALIVNVVKACHNPEIVSELEPVLQAAESIGQQDLAAVIRRILNGARDVSLTKGLDDDDMVIVEAILRGLQDPASLPDPDARPAILVLKKLFAGVRVIFGDKMSKIDKDRPGPIKLERRLVDRTPLGSGRARRDIRNHTRYRSCGAGSRHA